MDRSLVQLIYCSWEQTKRQQSLDSHCNNMSKARYYSSTSKLYLILGYKIMKKNLPEVDNHYQKLLKTISLGKERIINTLLDMLPTLFTSWKDQKLLICSRKGCVVFDVVMYQNQNCTLATILKMLPSYHRSITTVSFLTCTRCSNWDISR